MAESKSGSFIVNNNTGSFTVNVDADQLTDGQKTMSVQIRKDSVRGQVIGNLSAPITINDTSFTPAGTIVSQGCVPGTYTYRVTKANGTGGVYNEDTPNSVSCGYVAPPTYPVAGTVLSESCVPGTYTYRITRANGTGGTTIEDTPNSVSCGYVAPTNPVYSFTRSVNNVNEGSSFNITFNTNQSGSFPYTISGVSSADIGGASLSGSVTNGQVLTFNVTADTTTEGTETFTISLNNGQANTTVTINDTSIAPNIITRTMNWSQSNGDFTLFVETGNFTGWIGDITKSNVLIDNAERNNVVNNSAVRQGFRDLGNILGITITDSDITTGLNSVVDDFNSAINNYIGSNTQAVCLAGQPAKFTTQTSFIQNGKRYTRTTLRVSQINYGIDFSGLPPISELAEQATVELVNELARNGYNVNQSQRSQLKNSIIGIVQSTIDILRSISDNVDLYNYTEQPI